MFESLYPADDIWEKFDIPPMTLFPELSGVEGSLEPPRVVPSHVMGGRHDCMWAGTCSSGQHQRQCCEPEPEPEPVVAVTVTLRRSLLRTNRNRARSTSPRPETPSESEEEECSSVFSSVCDQEDLSVAVSVSEVTGQISRTKCETKSVSPVPPQSPLPSYYTDHSYHLSKTAVTLENLGVQTPSDSGHVARMGESRNAYRVLVGRPEGKRPLGRPRRRWEDNIKMDLREVGYDDRDWINLAQDRDQWRAYVRAAVNLRINENKTKTMVVGRQMKKENLRILNEAVEQVDSYEYLRCSIRNNMSCCQEVKRRLAMTKEAFNRERSMFCGPGERTKEETSEVMCMECDIVRGRNMDITTKRLRWAGHVARMGESRNAYRVLVGRPEGKRPLGRPRRRWEDNIKMDLREVGYDDRDWINLAQDRDRWRAYVRAAMNLRGGRVVQLVEQLATDWKVPGSIPGGDRIFSRCQTLITAPRFNQPPIKLSTGSFVGVEGDESWTPSPKSSPRKSQEEVFYLSSCFLPCPEPETRNSESSWAPPQSHECDSRRPTETGGTGTLETAVIADGHTKMGENSPPAPSEESELTTSPRKRSLSQAIGEIDEAKPSKRRKISEVTFDGSWSPSSSEFEGPDRELQSIGLQNIAIRNFDDYTNVWNRPQVWWRPKTPEPQIRKSEGSWTPLSPEWDYRRPTETWRPRTPDSVTEYLNEEPWTEDVSSENSLPEIYKESGRAVSRRKRSSTQFYDSTAYERVKRRRKRRKVSEAGTSVGRKRMALAEIHPQTLTSNEIPNVAPPIVDSESANAVRILFQERFPDVQLPGRTTIHRLVNKLRETGSLLDKKHNKPRTVLTEETLDNIRQALERSPTKSLRRLSQQMEISYGSVRMAMKLLKLKPYKQVAEMLEQRREASSGLIIVPQDVTSAATVAATADVCRSADRCLRVARPSTLPELAAAGGARFPKFGRRARVSKRPFTTVTNAASLCSRSEVLHNLNFPA
ncbi:hypothetical protein ANN_00289 [Periplaneta americana]|uniref:DUF4817 domain-containing protein n=1 Tax=Periplaneta americana TaxID=6978 RepID=A0ABQ8TS64_PERAM|nr:hypothetical protein ANN_00289 [Periplaneta americana]